MKKFALSEAARILGIRRNKIYKLTLTHRVMLGQHIGSDDTGLKTITEKGIDILRVVLGLSLHQSQSVPADNSTNNNEYYHPEPDLSGSPSGTASGQLDPVMFQFMQDTINNLITQLDQARKNCAEKDRLAAEQQQRSDTIIMKLSNDLSNAVKAIEGSRAEIRLLENRMSEAVQVKAGKEAEPEVVKSGGWMKRLGDLFFVDVAPEVPDRFANMGNYDFRYL